MIEKNFEKKFRDAKKNRDRKKIAIEKKFRKNFQKFQKNCEKSRKIVKNREKIVKICENREIPKIAKNPEKCRKIAFFAKKVTTLPVYKLFFLKVL